MKLAASRDSLGVGTIAEEENGLESGLEERRVRAMRRRKESVGFVLIVRMGTPFLFPTTSALTA
jgi:hypothetical protein